MRTAQKKRSSGWSSCWHIALALLPWIPRSTSASTRTLRGRFARASPKAPSFRWRRRRMVICGWARNSDCSASMASEPSRGSRQTVSNCPAIGSTTFWLRATALFGLAQTRDLPVGRTASLRNIQKLPGTAFTSLLQDAEGTLWFGVENPGRLCAVRAAKTQCYGAGSFGWSVSALYEDHKGNLWVSAQTGLWRWAPGPPEHYTVARRAFRPTHYSKTTTVHS